MARILNRPIMVREVRDGRPSAFRWPQTWRGVVEVLDEWVYRRPWWDAALHAEDPSQAEDVRFYRVQCGCGAVMEMCRTAAGWRLYREFD